METYQLERMSEVEKKELYREIDINYIEFLNTKCNKSLRIKQELQYKIMYYQGYPRYQEHFQRELNRLDMSFCSKLNTFSQRVR